MMDYCVKPLRFHIKSAKLLQFNTSFLIEILKVRPTLMRIFQFLAVTLSLAISASSLAALPPAVDGKTLPSLAPMLQQVMPSVVNIAAQGEMTGSSESTTPSNNNSQGGNSQGGNTTHEFASLGSGVIVDGAHGFIVTNAHVVQDAKIITVTLSDGRTFKAQLKGVDSGSDIALLQINATNLQTIPIANSDDLKVGDFVAAIGNPFGLSQTVTSGIISGLSRGDLGIEGAQGLENFIQTDASINPGNSGGALVNLDGQLIGINTAILAPSGGNIGIGFAIPSNLMKIVVQQLLQYGSVKRGLMGVVVQNFTPDLATAFGISGVKGALITQVTPNSPAQKIGLQAGDVITKVNGKPMVDATAVRITVGLLRVGADVNVEIIRNHQTMDLTLTTADPDQYMKETEESNPFLWGLTLRSFDEQTATEGHLTGVQVIYVSKDSPAWRAGLHRGDVILSANLIPSPNVAALQAAAAKDKTKLLLNVALAGGGAIYVLVD